MKGVAIVLVLSQVLLLPMMALASEENPRYHENYYALLSPTGELKQSSVVRQYEARGMQTVTDYGKYSSIKNLSNGVDAESDGERHVFHFPNGAPETLYIEGGDNRAFRHSSLENSDYLRVKRLGSGPLRACRRKEPRKNSC